MIKYYIKQTTVKGEKYKVVNDGVVEYHMKRKIIITDKIKIEEKNS